MKYFLVVQLPAFSLTPDRFAVESAFGVHLRLLRHCIGDEFTELVLVSPCFTHQPGPEELARLEVIDAAASGIRYLPAFPVTVSRKDFLLRRLLPTWLWLLNLFSKPCVVHAGMSSELARPLMFMASLAGRSRGRKVMFFVDMDFRQHTQRLHEAGVWGRRAYVVNRWLYDPLMRLQLWLAPRLFAVCCYKGERLARDYGKGRSNVHAFFDTVHSEADILGSAARERRSQWLQLTSTPFRAVYFGRLAFNKGVDKMIEATRLARQAGLDLRLRIIGGGEERDRLVRQIESSQQSPFIELMDPVPYGPTLFSKLEDCHLLLAAPLMEDTPRSAFDAMSRGLPVVAFDLDYYRELEHKSGAVVTTPWASAEGMALAIQQLANDRKTLAGMMERGYDFAAANTQESWLRRRMEWLLAAQ